MKRMLLSSVAVAALMSGGAFGADLPVRTMASPPAPVAFAPSFTWAGVYAGVNIGAARRDSDGVLDLENEDGDLIPLAGIGLDPLRFGDRNTWRLTGGAQVGVNGQWGNLVAGLEADFNWLAGGFRGGSVEESEDCDFEGPCIPFENTVSVRGDSPRWLSTVRGRLGFAWDRFLVYGTGGVAFQEAARVTVETSGFGTTVLSSRRNQVGWAAGVGIEWAFMGNMSLGLEYLRADFGSFDVRYRQPVGPIIRIGTSDERSVRVDDKVDLVRLKLNARF
jgi:outer membrane immunogenic protein